MYSLFIILTGDTMDKIEKIRKELGELYLKEGLSYRVLELSRKLDKELIKIQLDKLDKNKI